MSLLFHPAKVSRIDLHSGAMSACRSHTVLFSSELKLSCLCCYGLILMVLKGPHAKVWVTSLWCNLEMVEALEGGAEWRSQVTVAMFLNGIAGLALLPPSWLQREWAYVS